MQTLIVGLGNPILGDDGAGWRIAERVAEILPPASASLEGQQLNKDAQSIRVECLSLGGLSLMEHLEGYDQVILVDTIQTGQVPVGTVSTFLLDELNDVSSGHTTSIHDTSLQNALRVGRTMGVKLPEKIIVVAVEAGNVYDFSESMTPPVAESIPVAVQKVMELIR
jgi:hydrogenase maturation protease